MRIELVGTARVFVLGMLTLSGCSGRDARVETGRVDEDQHASVDASSTELSPLSTSLCSWRSLHLQELRLADGKPDYVEFRSLGFREAAGWRCRTTHDVDSCAASYRAIALPEDNTTHRWQLLIERKGLFRMVDNEAGLLAVLGPIDTLAEARLLLGIRGYDLSCGEIRPTAEARGRAWLFNVVRSWELTGVDAGEGRRALEQQRVEVQAKNGTVNVLAVLRLSTR